MHSHKSLTCDENQECTRHILPDDRFTFAESLRDVLIPRYIDGYIACETMTDEYCKRQHALNRLSFSKRRETQQTHIQSYQNLSTQFLVWCIKLQRLHIILGEVQCDRSQGLVTITQVAEEAHCNVEHHNDYHGCRWNVNISDGTNATILQNTSMQYTHID